MANTGLFRRFCRDEAGATAIEYGLIAALIAVALISSFTVMGGSLQNLFNSGAGSAGDTIAEQVKQLPGG